MVFGMEHPPVIKSDTCLKRHLIPIQLGMSRKWDSAAAAKLQGELSFGGYF
jgi:hypothetical protein